MIAVVQRVKGASCSVNEEVISRTGDGLLILVGVGSNDTINDANKLAEKCVYLRCFDDGNGKMNFSLMDINGECMVISQVTLLADTSRGRRPDFSKASPPDCANELYRNFVDALKRFDIKVKEGIFGAHMQIALVNDGPVTLIVES
ncbi:D-tyrosyl-tRNA(Tyr) deacylase [candidate division WOR-3 bacterium JGI_Cruoil_03_44_89]|uniref:D-aminoacyl-tRNA deacylase n=1 Tax=candidate division WOR-3 bacterium JGI_Cruoil_03_44_89 TaxID=1973748 RepID=A0A235BYR1_UNCW3|nr:MAG: D-tyrosyl-tRNA(Tyr) deacylase [candidate division WOR-3 bacterium JGI_Cruoil_03_44_89]